MYDIIVFTLYCRDLKKSLLYTEIIIVFYSILYIEILKKLLSIVY